jgi:heterodisulfide reductase subunit B
MREMSLSYFPGCTLRTKAKNLYDSTFASVTALGIELRELPGWVCCGVVPPLVTDTVMTFLPSVRNLANAGKRGDKLVTTCSFCYNTLKRGNKIMAEDRGKRDKINQFIEEDYRGSVQVMHFLEVLRDDIGLEALRRRVKNNLKGLSAAPYYGCLLLRPFEIVGIDNPENPSILENFLRSLGSEAIDFPYRTECCGSYLTLRENDLAIERSHAILASAARNGAEVVVLSCPLCHFNLDQRQEEILKRYRDFTKIPILYFTQLLGVALGVWKETGLDQHQVDPRPLLKSKKLI